MHLIEPPCALDSAAWLLIANRDHSANTITVMKSSLLLVLLLQGTSPAQNASVAGEIRALDGTPAAGIRVAAKEVPRPNETSKESALARIAQTDKAGQYRLADIPPGRYYITAGFVDFPTYYPGVSSISEARIVEVVPGAMIVKLDFVLVHSAGAGVSGRVSGLPQDILGDLRVVLMLANPPNGPLKFLNSIIKADGSFEFKGVSRGRYALRVVRSRTASTIDWPYAPVVSTFEVIDKDVLGLELEVSPAVVR
jgi:hypothetical protein